MSKITTIINPIINPITNNPFVLGPQGPYENENEAIAKLFDFYKDSSNIPNGQQVIIQGDTYVWKDGLHRLQYGNETPSVPTEGLSTSAKVALIECLQSMAFATNNGASKINRLMDALGIIEEDFTIDGYVKDGLVLYLDAHTVSNEDTTWSSKIGNYTFTNTNQLPTANAPIGFHKMDNGVVFDGNYAWLHPTVTLDNMFLASSNGTLEIVFKHMDTTNNAESIFVTHNSDDRIEFVKGLWYRGSTGSYVCKLQKHYENGIIGFYNDKLLLPTTVSLVYKHSIVSPYIQSVKQEFTASGGTMGCDYYCIGGRATNKASDPFYLMHGIVYSIRYYNRCLTDEEIANNMKIDAINYNL